MITTLKEVSIFLVISSLFAIGGVQAWNKQEQIECIKWQKQAQEFENYYLLGWQKEQCDHWGIEIDAQVKTRY